MLVISALGFLLVASAQAQDPPSFLSSVPGMATITSIIPSDALSSFIPQEASEGLNTLTQSSENILSSLISAPASAITSGSMNAARSIITPSSSEPLSFPFHLGKLLPQSPKSKVVSNSKLPKEKPLVEISGPQVLAKESKFVGAMAKRDPERLKKIILRAAEMAEVSLEESEAQMIGKLMEDAIVVASPRTPAKEADPTRGTILGPAQPLVDMMYLGGWAFTNPFDMFGYKFKKLIECEENPNQHECSKIDMII